MLHALIMAGGAGTRFWPASRKRRPKQLLDLAGEQSMIQSTVSRLGALVEPDQLMILTNQQLVAPMREQLPQLPEQAIVGEPCKRDTGPCVGLAAAIMQHRDPDATMVVMPADHVIGPDDVFQQALQRGVDLVEQHPRRLVTFGIRPTYAAESFGYIQRGVALADDPGQTQPATSFRVERFREKPKREVAEEYLAAGTFYWNAGIFVWKAATILEALREYEPQMAAHVSTIAESLDSDRYPDVLQREFEAIPAKSIDFAVMERYPEVAVVEAPFKWDDVGSWRALERLFESDDSHNTVLGKHLSLRTRNCIVRSSDEHLVATVGVEDLIIVHTDNATLVAHRNDEESIRELVKLLEENGWDEYL